MLFRSTDRETEASCEQNAFPVAIIGAAAWSVSSGQPEVLFCGHQQPPHSSRTTDSIPAHHQPQTFITHSQSSFPSPLVSKMEIIAVSTSLDYWEDEDGPYRYTIYYKILALFPMLCNTPLSLCYTNSLYTPLTHPSLSHALA